MKLHLESESTLDIRLCSMGTRQAVGDGVCGVWRPESRCGEALCRMMAVQTVSLGISTAAVGGRMPVGAPMTVNGALVSQHLPGT